MLEQFLFYVRLKVLMIIKLIQNVSAVAPESFVPDSLVPKYLAPESMTIECPSLCFQPLTMLLQKAAAGQSGPLGVDRAAVIQVLV